MDQPSFSNFSTVIGVISGLLAIFGAFKFLTAQSHLPESRLRHLETLLDETERLFESMVEEGERVSEIRLEDQGLADIRKEMHGYRQRVYAATSFARQYQEFFKGLSFAIISTSNKIKAIRARVVSSEQRSISDDFHSLSLLQYPTTRSNTAASGSGAYDLAPLRRRIRRASFDSDIAEITVEPPSRPSSADSIESIARPHFLSPDEAIRPLPMPIPILPPEIPIRDGKLPFGFVPMTIHQNDSSSTTTHDSSGSSDEESPKLKPRRVISSIDATAAFDSDADSSKEEISGKEPPGDLLPPLDTFRTDPRSSPKIKLRTFSTAVPAVW